MARRLQFRQLGQLTQAAAFAAVASLFCLAPALSNATVAMATPSPAVPTPNASPTPSPTPTSQGSQPPQASPAAKLKTAKPDEWTQARRVFEQLSLDQQKKFLDNLDQWKSLSPEAQELFRDRELFRREKIALEIQDAITKTGLHLDSDQAEVYALRYTQERRKIEETLHKEMDQKRQVMLAELLGRLKTEFAHTPTPAPKPGGSPSAR